MTPVSENAGALPAGGLFATYEHGGVAQDSRLPGWSMVDPRNDEANLAQLRVVQPGGLQL